MKVIVAGSRHIVAMNLVTDAINNARFGITEVVCGEAAGVDSLGKKWAEENNIPVASFPALWNNFDVEPCKIKYNKHGDPYNALAGYNRNEQMACYADALIAIWDGESAGTKDMIDRAIQHDLDLYIYRTDKGWWEE